MENTLLITSLALFTLLAGVCSIVFNRIKLPPLIGYLMAGIIVANFWHTSVEGEMVVSILSDMGLVMLMFCIGMEINLKKIRKQGVLAIIVAAIQLPLMVLGGVFVGSMLGFDSLQSLCLGAIISGSSTAVVMAVLKSQKRLTKEQIETLVLITIMEDIGQVIILSILAPMLAGSAMDTTGLIVMIVSIIAFMALSIVIGLRFIPRVINWVSNNTSSEILVVLSIGLAFGMALLSTYIGLSMAIGAFLMGMMIAGSRKAKEINHDIEPMKNLFMSMFFISVGMEVSLNTLWENIGLILIIFITFAVLKSSTVFLGYWVSNQSCRTGFMSAVSLCAMGEFAFIIAKEALDFGVVNEAFYTSVIGAALVSMIALPILTTVSNKGWDAAAKACPAPLYNGFNRINSMRADFYSSMSATSKKSKKNIVKMFTYSYVDILFIAIVVIVFYYIMADASAWLDATFGNGTTTWSIILLMVEFLLMFLPMTQLVSNIKGMDAAIAVGAERLSLRDKDEASNRVHRKVLLINTYVISAILVMIILIIVPNQLGMWEHMAVFGAALVLLAILAVWKLRKDNAVVDDVVDDEDEDESRAFKQLLIDKFGGLLSDSADKAPEKTDASGEAPSASDRDDSPSEEELENDDDDASNIKVTAPEADAVQTKIVDDDDRPSMEELENDDDDASNIKVTVLDDEDAQADPEITHEEMARRDNLIQESLDKYAH